MACHCGRRVADGWTITRCTVRGGLGDRWIPGTTGAAPMFGKWLTATGSARTYKTGRNFSHRRGVQRRKLPIDNIVQDWWYWANTAGRYEIDEDTYPEMEKTIAALHKMNFHIMISICRNSRDFGFIRRWTRKAHRKKSRGADPSIYDAHSEEARNIYWKYVKKGLFSKGLTPGDGRHGAEVRAGALPKSKRRR